MVVNRSQVRSAVLQRPGDGSPWTWAALTVKSVEERGPFPGVIGTFMGRDALRLGVSTSGVGPFDVALLPAYLCTEVLKPFKERCQVEFYDVGPDASIDPDVLEGMIARCRPKVVLFINYFGFLQPHRTRIKEVCAAGGALLIEDCAHSLLTEGSGETGDWVIHSFRKILPVPDGGGIRSNGTSARFQPQFRLQICSDVLSLLVILKSLLGLRSAAFSRAQLTRRYHWASPTAHSSTRKARLLPMSRLSRRRLNRMDYARVAARRREDFQFWLAWTSRTGGVEPLFDRLGEGVCPMGFPVLVRDRQELKARLEAQGLLIRTHWHLPDAVGSQFVNSHRLANETLTLPLFHELDERQRTRLA